MMRQRYSQLAFKHFGFTLAELLIALAILGVIATFTIPKILDSGSDSQRKAVMRETLSTLMAVTYEGLLTGELIGTNCESFYTSKINHVKECDTNSSLQGCWDPSGDFQGSFGGGQPGFIMHNGAYVAGLNDSAGECNTFAMDWNGAAGPNTEGEDQILLMMAWIDNNTAGCVTVGATKGGKITPPINFPTSVAFFQEIFSN